MNGAAILKLLEASEALKAATAAVSSSAGAVDIHNDATRTVFELTAAAWEALRTAETLLDNAERALLQAGLVQRSQKIPT